MFSLAGAAVILGLLLPYLTSELGRELVHYTTLCGMVLLHSLLKAVRTYQAELRYLSAGTSPPDAHADHADPALAPRTSLRAITGEGTVPRHALIALLWAILAFVASAPFQMVLAGCPRHRRRRLDPGGLSPGCIVALVASFASLRYFSETLWTTVAASLWALLEQIVLVVGVGAFGVWTFMTAYHALGVREWRIFHLIPQSWHWMLHPRFGWWVSMYLQVCEALWSVLLFVHMYAWVRVTCEIIADSLRPVPLPVVSP